MLKLFLEGVYNHGEVIWLETKWLLLRLSCTYIYRQSLGARGSPLHNLDDWVEIMPKYNLLRYCNWEGSITYRYTMPISEGCKPILQFKCWKPETSVVGAEVTEAIKKAHDKLFYKKLDSFLF